MSISAVNIAPSDISTSHSSSTYTTASSDFKFPPTHSFPPFYTPQPNTLTRTTQLKKWSALVLAYASHHRIYRSNVTSFLATPLCHNAAIRKRLSAEHLRDIIDFMASAEGGGQAEWLSATNTSSSGGSRPGEFFIYWRTPAEWAGLIEKWVDETGQKGVVLTLYELVEGEGSNGREWKGMDIDVLRKSLQVLVKRGKAAVFGGQGGDGEGVKIF